MRACLLVCAALALAPGPWARAAATRPLEPARLEHIKTQILAKLGLSTRPTPLGTPPRDVVRQILARAADPHPEPPETEHSMREIIAIAHRDFLKKRLTPGIVCSTVLRGSVCMAWGVWYQNSKRSPAQQCLCPDLFWLS
ncbi:unnamed protein product [Leptosia nina]|uniref:Uncharacterized protein n=1 Tax=Leptosia nina TaxID=320188 RepID=A0AAV1JEY5_9NEOP